MSNTLDHENESDAFRSSNEDGSLIAISSDQIIVLTEGTAWPGGLEQKRFGWLENPSSEEEVVEGLLHALDADMGEHEAVLAWGDDAGELAACKPGVIAYVVRTREASMSPDYLERLAREIAGKRGQIAALHVRVDDVQGSALEILEMARA